MPRSRSSRQTAKPSRPGQHHVEDDDVVRRRPRHPQRLVPGAGDVGGVALLHETAPEQRRHLQLVLDDQRAHAHIVALLRENEMRAG